MFEFLKRGRPVMVVKDIEIYQELVRDQREMMRQQADLVQLLVHALIGVRSPLVARRNDLIPTVPMSQTAPTEIDDYQAQADLEANVSQ